MNQWLLLSPIGMILIAVGYVIYWRIKNKTKIKLFITGGILWVIAIALKLGMDITITNSINQYLTNTLPTLYLLIISIILGLRTGFFESGTSYLILKKRLKKIKWADMIAIGIGFGATESLFLGLTTLINMMVLMNPEFLALLGETERNYIEAQLNQNTIVVLAAWIERFFAVIAHTFATVLVITSIKLKKINYLWISIAYKTLFDAPVPYIQSLIQSNPVIMVFIAELFVTGMGLLGLKGINWLKKA